MDMRQSPAVRALALILLLATAARAGDDGSRLFTASDLPALAEGVPIAHGGEYAVRVWGPARVRWSLDAEGQALTLSPRVEGDDDAPSWQDLGRVSLSADDPLTITVAAPEEPGDEGEETDEEADEEAEPLPCPALLVLASDPDSSAEAWLHAVRARVDDAAPPADPRRRLIRTNEEGADFRAPETAAAWQARAEAVREQLRITLGLWPAFAIEGREAVVFGKVERDGYTIEKVVLETFPGFTLAGNLYRPAPSTGRAPLVLCPHGHWPEGRVNVDVQSRCIRLAKLGCVVFLYDMVGYGDSSDFGHAFLNDRLRRFGLSLATLQTWNSQRALDWLLRLPDVDPRRVACTGESGGGTQTFLLTAIDDRVRVAAPVVMVSHAFQGGCVCENAAGLRLGTDNVEFAALAAPRPLKLVGATGDWTKLTLTRAYPAIRRVYTLLGVPDRVEAEVFDFPHNYNETSRNAVYPFLARWLFGPDRPEDVREGELTTEDPDDLLVTRGDHPEFPGLGSPQALEDELIARRQLALDTLSPGAEATAWEASRVSLRKALEVRTAIVNPTPAEMVARPRSKASGRPGSGGAVALVMHPRGKAGLAGADGGPSPMVRELLDRGLEVVGFDPLLVGESVDPMAPASRRPETTYFDTYNRSLAADRMQDLATVLAWLRSRDDVRAVHLVAIGEAGPLALLARPLLPGIGRTAIDLGGFDYGDGTGDVPEGLDLPGVLQFGGLPMAASLCAPAPLRISGAPDSFEASWPRRAYELAGSADALRIDAGPARSLAGWIADGDEEAAR